jgi:adenylate cyclase
VVVSENEKQFIHKAFSTYLSGDVVKELIADPSLLQLGGNKRRMSAVFTDIQGFSTISEQLDPSQLVKLLNLYLTEMSNIIMENQGTIDKYEGDGTAKRYIARCRDYIERPPPPDWDGIFNLSRK